MDKTDKIKKGAMSLEQFQAFPMAQAWKTVVQQENQDLFKNCRSFIECHTRVQEETGIWIEELVPVFKKLDASLTEIR